MTNDELRAALARAEAAEATAAALRQAAIDLTNQLGQQRFPDEGALWRLGGQGLERDYQALKEALATDAGQTLLARLERAEAGAAALRTVLANVAAVLHWRHREEEPGLAFDQCPRDACTSIRETLSGQAGQALLAELTALRARNDTLTSIIQGAGEQLGQGEIPLAVAIAQLHSKHMDAWKLIGRCDMALELVAGAPSASTVKRIATQMRAEIEKASGKGAGDGL